MGAGGALPHQIGLIRWMGSVVGVTRPRMDTKQFRQGFQWGGVIWLVHVVVSSVRHIRAVNPFFLPYLIPAAAWALALALTWTRWSRIAVALAMVTQVWAAVAMTAGMHELGVTLSAFMPPCLPIVPLLFMVPEHPRLTAALALIGRFRDAAGTLAGWRWPLVAAGVLLLDRSGWAALSTSWSSEASIRIPGQDILIAFAPQIVLFGLAAIPRRRVLATA
jgi:hypothetical protein